MLTKERIDHTISKIRFQPRGAPTLLLNGEEALVVTCSEMKALVSNISLLILILLLLNLIVSQRNVDQK